MRFVRYVVSQGGEGGYLSIDIYLHHGRSVVTSGHILENPETGSVIVFNGTVEDVAETELDRVLSHSALHRLGRR